MTGVKRTFKRGKVWWVAYYTHVAMKQLGRRVLSMFHRYKIVGEAAACGQ